MIGLQVFIGLISLPEPSRLSITIAGIVVLVILMGLSGFFSSSEIAMFSLAQHRIDALIQDDAPGAERVRSLRNDPHRLLVTILIGNNIANIGMSSIATGLLTFYVPPEQSVLIATVGITSLVLLFSESAPKSYAIENAESWSLRIAFPLQLIQRILFPLVVVFDYLTQIVNRITGSEDSIETAYVTRAELRDLIEVGERHGVIEPTERDILQRTFRFTDTIAREIMIPRTDITAVQRDATISEAIDTCLTTGHPRLPVYEGDFETMLGTVHIIDLVRQRIYGAEHDGELVELVRPTTTVPDTKPVDELLAEMQHERLYMVFVIDEFGGFGGLVTIEDILEELVGEILRPTEEPPIKVIGDDTAIVRGDVSIEIINETLDLDFPTAGPYETIAGLVLAEAGELVEEGETVETHGVRIDPIRVDDGRIISVKITRQPQV